MKVFVTGASGFIGGALVRQLQQAGHTVLGLARSASASDKLASMGAEAHPGSLEDNASLQAGARAADAVIHLGFALDVTSEDPAAAIAVALEHERSNIAAIAEVLAGTGKAFVVASGVVFYESGDDRDGTGLITETTPLKKPTSGPAERSKSEELLLGLAQEKGFRGSVVRLGAIVHDAGDNKAFVSLMRGAAEGNGYVASIDGGANRWTAVHREDAAKVLCLAVEKGGPNLGPTKGMYHAIAECVPMREISKAISQGLDLPLVAKSRAEAEEVMPVVFAHVFSKDNWVSSALTQQELGWKPTEMGVVEDIEKNYFK